MDVLNGKYKITSRIPMKGIKKILVTGYNGFIGMHLCARLEERGINVISPGEAEKKQKNMKNRIDITRLDKLYGLKSKAQAIVHLAAKSSVPDSFNRPYETYHTNILGTLNLLELARLKKIGRVIFVSSYIYGEPLYLPVDEKHPVNPHSPYQRSKLIAEQLCENYSKDFGIDIVTLRPFYIYGPGSRSYSFISSAIRQIKKDGKVLLSGEYTSRDFLFISDFINLIQNILNNFPSGYNVYNVGYGKSYTLREVSQLLGALLDKDVTLEYDTSMRPNDIISMAANISKVSGAFNWKPSVGVEAGLKLTVDDFKY